jgi:two-component system, OmpR family, phosphate regulon sensor histidine kinase PhoR
MWIAVLVSIIVVLLAGLVLVVQWYMAQRDTVSSIRNLVDHLLHGRQTRRVHEGARGEVGELAKAINLLAADLEQKTTKAQQDQDHLLSLLKLLDSTDEFVTATDNLDVVRLISPAAARLLGRPAEALINRPIDEVLTQKAMLELYRRAFTTNTPVAAQITIETGERILHCQATAATIYNGAHYRGTLLLMRDVTEIVKTLQIKTDFVANASHELRTPLASIRAAVETVEDAGVEDQETLRRCVGIIGNHALRLQMMVQDLLDLSRTEDPRAEVRLERIDLEEICHMIMGMYNIQAEAKTVALKVELADDSRTMRGDARLVQLTLKNLVDNAIKFTNQGSVTIRAYRSFQFPVSSFQREEETGAKGNRNGHGENGAGYFVLEVVDTGVGIPKENQERVFERFYTVNQSRGGADRGTGLGLAIVKHAVMHMGGTVELESEVGKGTTIRCVFPLRSGAVELAEAS